MTISTHKFHIYRFFICLIFLATSYSCKSSKQVEAKKSNPSEIVTKKVSDEPTKYIEPKTEPEHNVVEAEEIVKSKAEYIIAYAKQFQGVKYRWGGTTKAGIDCSGLIYESFKSQDITLPRISRDMAKKGKKIALKKVHTGDLLFFKTGNRRNSINHVGLIVAIRNNDIEFIHASTKKGVIISHLNEIYWLKAFHEARRIL
ncbi:C40 family peptidase [Tamlana fucoidanivorans]|uniref:NlpC/P60 family protein n=1 Tax=Allotamlana fucoidanivorans TaxID=2583814 RepID=A0A5C4SLA8_9FLAO|nr:C40 family peptidase [Tamlana fucoidanivorans]TNJ44724.1 NlpC/P60 family protein [Tamlana fucoidanivorans]